MLCVRWRRKRWPCPSTVVFVVAVVALFLYTMRLTARLSDGCPPAAACPTARAPRPGDGADGTDDAMWGEHRLAVIVPFRDRFDELLEFVPHMHRFLNAQHVRHRIFVVSQADSLR